MPGANAVGPPDVILIAGQNDGVAIRLRQALERRGRRITQLDGPGAGRFFTLRGGPEGTTVAPQLPVFIRPSAWWQVETADSADARFLRSECYAAYWAATALSAATVINRPGPAGPIHRLTAAAITTMPAAGAAPVSEIFASGPDRIDDQDAIWGEDVDYRTGPVAGLRPDLPLRARRVQTDARYEIVTVVGHRAFAATTDPRTIADSFGPRSAALAVAAGVHFATVTWAVTETDAVPVRLNAAPEEWELRYAWSDVAAALCEDLCQGFCQDRAQ
jgi:hypothetical protein